MAITVVDSLDQQVWRDFVDSHPQGNIFHTPEMFQVFSRTKGHTPKLWAALDEKNLVLALMTPVEVTLFGGPLRKLTTRSIAYGGILSAPGAQGQLGLKTLLEHYSRESAKKILFTELRNLSDYTGLQPLLQSCDFSYQEHLDYLIDLDLTTEQVFENIGARTRKNLRRALRKGNVSVEIVSDPKLFTTWYALLCKTYQAARVPLADRSLFEAAFEVLQPLRMITFWLAKIEDTYVAATAELGYKDILYGWYSSVDRAFASECPGELLMWRVLEWGANNGYKMYDFGGAGKPSEAYGVRDFKAKFGGELVCYGRNTKVHAPHLLRWSKWGYEMYRRARSHLNTLTASKAKQNETNEPTV